MVGELAGKFSEALAEPARTGRAKFWHYQKASSNSVLDRFPRRAAGHEAERWGRVLRGSSTGEQLRSVSVFEPGHGSDSQRQEPVSQPEFGKMVKIQEAEKRIVIHCEVFDQRPSRFRPC